jgi:DNA-binding beta-propeller fold protein YncE
MTSVDDRLFVLRAPTKLGTESEVRAQCHQSIEVFDLKTVTLQPQTLQVSDLNNSYSNVLTGCVINKCLYVSDYKDASVFKVELRANNKTRLSKWSVSGGHRPIGLSINTARNLLVACWDDHMIQEYNTTSGSLFREIRLKSNDGKSLNPFHVIQLSSGQFVVSCFNENSELHDVVEVDVKGQVVVSYTNQLQSTTRKYFKEPRDLAVDKNNECILVADCYNNRIVILSQSMNGCAREFDVTSVVSGLDRPSCLHLDESQGRLFISECHQYGRILVFDNVINIANSCYKWT